MLFTHRGKTIQISSPDTKQHHPHVCPRELCDMDLLSSEHQRSINHRHGARLMGPICVTYDSNLLTSFKHTESQYHFMHNLPVSSERFSWNELACSSLVGEGLENVQFDSFIWCHSPRESLHMIYTWSFLINLRQGNRQQQNPSNSWSGSIHPSTIMAR